MATQVNHVVMAGFLTRDPELRSTRSGTSVASVRLANNRREKQGDEWSDRANFFNVTIWGKTGEAVCQYLHKGSPLLVSGELRFEEWESEGGKRSDVKIVAREVQFLRGKDDDNGGGGGGTDVPVDSPAPAASSGSEDDIPFAFEEAPEWHEIKGHEQR